jgi:DNA sulfur modification protein DndD
MNLIRLTLKNFMPFKGETVLEFPQDQARNTVVVLGDNMRGKTSLLNGIRWALYEKAQGRHLRQIPLHLMPNREATAAGDWSMEARIELEADGNRYDLRREARKKSTVMQPSRPEDFLVFAHLKKNEAAIPANEIEAEINKFAPEQISRFFLFDGELLQEYEELLIESSEQGGKIKEAIEHALGVPALTNGRDDLQILLKRAQKEQAKEASTIKGLEIVAEQFAKWSGKRDVFECDMIDLKEKHARVKEEREALEE